MKKKERKNVSFPGAAEMTDSSVLAVTNHKLHELNSDEVQRRWFSPHDFATFRNSAKQIAKQAHLSVVNDLLKDSFAPEYAENTPLKSTDPLILWCRHAHSRRGLELWTSKEHNNHRCERKKRLIRSVISTQAIMKFKPQYDPASLEQKISDISIMHSRDAVAFAERMGLADADAAATKIEIKHMNRSIQNQSHPRCRPLIMKRDADDIEQHRISETFSLVGIPKHQIIRNSMSSI
mmetsp:Transcript_14232/g.21038  ORF Transcript_14232/g.21038 Transcript_14232/m.21038 type:complete len:236 (+) Transcript_14232:270-977(+)